MEINMKQFLSKIVLVIKKRKKLFIVIFVILTLYIGLFIFTKRQPTTNKILPSPTSSPNTNLSNTNYKRVENAPVYILNRFNSLTDILGYTWQDNKIIYATKNGIFTLWQNKQLVNKQIDYINFNPNGKAIFSNQNIYYLFDSFENSTKQIGSDLGSPQLSGSGNYVVYQKENLLNLQSVKNNQTKTLNLTDSQNINFGWARNNDSFYIYKRNLNLIDIYDINLTLINTIKINGNSRLIDISEDSQKLITVNKNSLSLIDSHGNTLNTFEFSQSSTLNSYWIDTNQAFVIETVKRGSLDLFDDYIWVVDTNGNKKFITNSYPITNKLNLKTKLFTNKNKDFIVLNEKSGKLWILSLVPSKIATYLEEGVSFYPIGSNYKED
ncbi:MAG TPA: hypothetical protein VL401_03380 [Alphaproteobacteria bacterium]|jgi:hypothetical protein|nr:hypothetical protein [Alphaproteobacteria bacterium]